MPQPARIPPAAAPILGAAGPEPVARTAARACPAACQGRLAAAGEPAPPPAAVAHCALAARGAVGRAAAGRTGRTLGLRRRLVVPAREPVAATTDRAQPE